MNSSIMYRFIGIGLIISGIILLYKTSKYILDEMKQEKEFINKLLSVYHYDKTSMLAVGILLIVVGLFFLFGINIFE